MVTDVAGGNESAAPAALSILIADDSAVVQEDLRSWLTDCGHRVVAVGTGAEAVRHVRQHAFDLVITEVILPNGDGLELISATKKFQPGVGIIAYSGGGRYLTIGDCLRVAKGFGADEILAKPASREEILLVVGRVCAARRARVDVAH